MERCAGLDVHRDTVVAAVRIPPDTPGRNAAADTQTFATTSGGHHQAGDWLAEQQVTGVGMESTGVYWKPVYYLLEDSSRCGCSTPSTCTTCRAARPTWPTRRGSRSWSSTGWCGPASCRPRRFGELRDLTRYRSALIEERTREVQRLEKVMEDAGIKLTSVASTLLTESGRAMLEALLAGQDRPGVLAELAKARMRRKIPALREALAGRFASSTTRYWSLRCWPTSTPSTRPSPSSQRASKRRCTLRRPVERLDTIPGVARRTASMLCRIGADMTGFPTAAHLASGPGSVRATTSPAGRADRADPERLGGAANRLDRGRPRRRPHKGTYLAAHHAHIRGRRGQLKAVGATRHDLLIAYWHVVHDHVDYADLGPDWAQRRRSTEQRTRRLVRQLEQLGHTVTIGPAK